MPEYDRVPALIMKMKALRKSLSNRKEQSSPTSSINPEEVVYLSVSGLAEKGGVSDGNRCPNL